MERDDIQRILTLVQEGKLDAKEALTLIESIEKDPQHTDAGEQRPDLNQLKDKIDHLTKTLRSSETWKQVEEQFRVSSQKGMESLKSIANQIQRQASVWNLFQSTAKKELQLPLDVPVNKILGINHKIGKIRIKGDAPVSFIKITATLEGKDEEEARQRAETFIPVIEQSEDHVFIKMPDQAGLVADLDIELSTDCALDIKLLQGNINISHTKGAINLYVSSGNIFIRECKSQKIHIEAALGNVLLNLLEPFKGNCKLHVAQGIAECKLPENSGCKLDFKVVTGAIECNLPLEQEHRESTHLMGTLGDGLGKLEVHVATGKIIVSPV